MIATDKGGVGLLGLIIALIAVGLAVANGDDVIGVSGGTTYNNATYAGGNWTIDFNSSNWYPDSRQFNTLYWNNQSKPIIIDIVAGNLTAVTTMNYSLLINGTETQKHISAVAGMRFTTIYQFIPQYSSYNVTNTSSITQTYITWLEHNLTFTPSIVNNYYNTTGGGGVSFNGSPVDLNGSSFYNGSQQAGTFNHSNLTNLNWRNANHTIDDVLDMQGYNISNANYTQANNFIYTENKSVAISAFAPEWHYYAQSERNTNLIAMVTSSSNFSYSTNFFGGFRSRGNFSYPLPCQNDDALFYFYGISYDGTQWKTSNTNPNIVLRCSGTWTTISNPTKITMATTASGSTSQVKRFELDGRQLNLTLNTIKIDGMQQSDPSGSANMYVCWDSGTNQTFLSSGACV